MIDAFAPELLIERLDTVGWLVLPSLIDDGLIEDLTAQIEASLALRRDIRRRNRVDGNNDGTLHHLLGDHPCFVELLARFEQLDNLFDRHHRPRVSRRWRSRCRFFGGMDAERQQSDGGQQ